MWKLLVSITLSSIFTTYAIVVDKNGDSSKGCQTCGGCQFFLTYLIPQVPDPETVTTEELTKLIKDLFTTNATVSTSTGRTPVKSRSIRQCILDRTEKLHEILNERKILSVYEICVGIGMCGY
uniref:Saposin B-type domain-containing protein n=1 Tax=Bursaphelenchus xylophilus TaxID=6326 RepID=A0A1I7SAT9_BURXY